MPLEQYRDKRKFSRTPEPKGRTLGSSRKLIFVVQKHRARQLHYDFRLAINDVLVSWAVPKGPTLDPATKRFATMTEDHPFEYANFEGTIPQGQYGAGSVMVWDRGAYEVAGETPVEKQLERGEIKVVLHGQKLQGEFVLIHVGRRATNPREKSRWLLIKKRDEYARPGSSPEDSQFSRSVLSGLTLEEIANGQPAGTKAA